VAFQAVLKYANHWARRRLRRLSGCVHEWSGMVMFHRHALTEISSKVRVGLMQQVVDQWCCLTHWTRSSRHSAVLLWSRWSRRRVERRNSTFALTAATDSFSVSKALLLWKRYVTRRRAQNKRDSAIQHVMLRREKHFIFKNWVLHTAGAVFCRCRAGVKRKLYLACWRAELRSVVDLKARGPVLKQRAFKCWKM
jgi:hypothetical protein